MSKGLDENQLVSSEITGQVNDIKGYWRQGDYNFNSIDMCEGQIILYEDGWFEGIVNDPHSSYTDDRFVFGAYLPDHFIELFKVTPSDISVPFIFRGKRDVKGYDGEFSFIGSFGEQLLGLNHIITQESENQDTTALQTKIDAWKKSMIDDPNNFVYENTVQMRSEMVEILKRQYANQKFSSQEMKWTKVAEPISNSAFEQSEKAVKSLLKSLHY